MEEEKLIKKDDSLDLKRKNDKYKIVIIILSFVLFLMTLLVVLYFINGKSGSDKNGTNPTPTPVITPEVTAEPVNNNETVELEEFSANNDNQIVTLKNGTINVRSSDGSLFVNGKKVYTSDSVGDGGTTYYEIYTNENLDYALVSSFKEGACISSVSGAINSKGEFVELNYKYSIAEPEQVACMNGIILKNGKTYGQFSYEDDTTHKPVEYEIEYSLK